ncbi:DinB superfamily protein [Nocardioides alpinus]|uniref:DinB family protein n=1 Tax=Nocardioides alpinus TaxID=748909 RepID=A0A1I1BBP3_9ACTN|nr:DinB family protein [Nocardioides alpinus]PKH41307.1 DinB family protein [Nocardioides alpinus]SFB45960.1 DinB superfamily protein [Nocardioides alpinus]
MSITPDTKDWTWVLDRPCPECGFDPSAQSLTDLPRAFHDTAMTWSDVLGRADVAVRPSPAVWSPLEYACHVRDVHELFAERVRLMLDEDTPTFANWDQDATAVERHYGEQDPAAVVVALIEAAGTVAGIYAGITDATRDRRGIRSNGDEFTVDTLGSYHLHDVVHHLHDVEAT